MIRIVMCSSSSSSSNMCSGCRGILGGRGIIITISIGVTIIGSGVNVHELSYEYDER